MSEEILINISPQETRVAVVENGMLQELMIERNKNKGLVGNIYLGKVVRVLPGMQAAFVDIGLSKSAFLHASDILEVKNIQNEAENIDESISVNQENDAAKESIPDITQLLKEGQDVTVQVIKDELGTKGARLSTQITLPSRYLVLLPDHEHIGVSQRIDNEEERQRLKIILSNVENLSSGFIVRTAAEGTDEEALLHDIGFLKKTWNKVQRKIQSQTAPSLLYEDLNLELRVIRDLLETKIEKIRVDLESAYHLMLDFASEFMPKIKDRIEFYQGRRPLFDVYNIDDEIEKALNRQVPLKSGGYLIIDQTEAMTTIDVNTGGFVGYRNLEETIFKTNLEAAVALARQLRLRNLGGIIIIDFIDMEEEEHKRQVIRALEKALEQDNVKNNISEVSELGLVQMTRKRIRESLERLLCEYCPTCQGRGMIRTVETVCYDIFREILRSARAFDAQKLLVLASQEVVDSLLYDEANSVAELEEVIKTPIRFQVEHLYSQEQFDVVFI